MLEHLSAKFRTPPQASLLEPRAALILNRFTRTLTVMYATNAVASILGVTPDQLKDKSFYECIQENCLAEAIRCLESAKANDSIAYLRFWYRNPCTQEDLDEEMHEGSISSDSEDGGVELTNRSEEMEFDSNTTMATSSSLSGDRENLEDDKAGSSRPHLSPTHQASRISSGASTDLGQDSSRSIFDSSAQPSRSSTSASSELLIVSSERPWRPRPVSVARSVAEPHEIEAVVSCTSDGLVVVLRRARPVIPTLQQPTPVSHYAQGLFAAPWGANPIRPHVHQFNPQYPFRHGLLAPQLPAGGPPVDEFMNSIREVAVFAWSLTGINGNIAAYGHGTPRGESLPPGGLPIWDPMAQPNTGYLSPENQALQRWSLSNEKRNEPQGFGAPYQQHQEVNLSRQNGYSHGSMELNRIATMNQDPFRNQVAFTYSPQIQEDRMALPLGHTWSTTIPANTNTYVPPQQGTLGSSSGESRRFW